MLYGTAHDVLNQHGSGLGVVIDSGPAGAAQDLDIALGVDPNGVAWMRLNGSYYSDSGSGLGPRELYAYVNGGYESGGQPDPAISAAAQLVDNVAGASMVYPGTNLYNSAVTMAKVVGALRNSYPQIPFSAYVAPPSPVAPALPAPAAPVALPAGVTLPPGYTLAQVLLGPPPQLQFGNVTVPLSTAMTHDVHAYKVDGAFIDWLDVTTGQTGVFNNTAYAAPVAPALPAGVTLPPGYQLAEVFLGPPPVLNFGDVVIALSANLTSDVHAYRVDGTVIHWLDVTTGQTGDFVNTAYNAAPVTPPTAPPPATPGSYNLPSGFLTLPAPLSGTSEIDLTGTDALPYYDQPFNSVGNPGKPTRLYIGDPGTLAPGGTQLISLDATKAGVGLIGYQASDLGAITMSNGRTYEMWKAVVWDAVAGAPVVTLYWNVEGSKGGLLIDVIAAPILNVTATIATGGLNQIVAAINPSLGTQVNDVVGGAVIAGVAAVVSAGALVPVVAPAIAVVAGAEGTAIGAINPNAAAIVEQATGAGVATGLVGGVIQAATAPDAVSAAVNGTPPPGGGTNLLSGDQTFTAATNAPDAGGTATIPASAAGGASGAPVAATGAGSAGATVSALTKAVAAAATTVGTGAVSMAIKQALAPGSGGYVPGQAAPPAAPTGAATVPAATSGLSLGKVLALGGAALLFLKKS